MKKFIELTGLDDHNNVIDVMVNVNKINYMSAIDGNGNENSSMSTTIYFDNCQSVQVIEHVCHINEIIEEKSLIESYK